MTVSSSDHGRARGVCSSRLQLRTLRYNVDIPCQVLLDKEAETVSLLMTQLGEWVLTPGAVPSLASIHRKILFSVSYFLDPGKCNYPGKTQQYCQQHCHPCRRTGGVCNIP